MARFARRRVQRSMGKSNRMWIARSARHGTFRKASRAAQHGQSSRTWIARYGRLDKLCSCAAECADSCCPICTDGSRLPLCTGLRILNTVGAVLFECKEPLKLWRGTFGALGRLVYVNKARPVLSGEFKVEFVHAGGNFHFWAQASYIGARLVLKCLDVAGYVNRRKYSPFLEIELSLSEASDQDMQLMMAPPDGMKPNPVTSKASLVIKAPPGKKPSEKKVIFGMANGGSKKGAKESSKESSSVQELDMDFGGIDLDAICAKPIRGDRGDMANAPAATANGFYESDSESEEDADAEHAAAEPQEQQAEPTSPQVSKDGEKRPVAAAKEEVVAMPGAVSGDTPTAAALPKAVQAYLQARSGEQQEAAPTSSRGVDAQRFTALAPRSGQSPNDVTPRPRVSPQPQTRPVEDVASADQPVPVANTSKQPEVMRPQSAARSEGAPEEQRAAPAGAAGEAQNMKRAEEAGEQQQVAPAEPVEPEEPEVKWDATSVSFEHGAANGFDTVDRAKMDEVENVFAMQLQGQASTGFYDDDDEDEEEAIQRSPVLQVKLSTTTKRQGFLDPSDDEDDEGEPAPDLEVDKSTRQGFMDPSDDDDDDD
ncbi:hypothetical protein CYMTET_49238 [Cymbomonas tetramitiformis]|uniref:PTEN2A/B C2 domain-containing protein n=1 Tax=Cymbomonas tetramitiformis TaxID=36881 RepID=A0AAE0BRW9_9CHLO|nr:hypothetical protein CYMTET_49238 [Cymbomonas tetramitiformis]